MSSFLTEDNVISQKNGSIAGYPLFEKGIVGETIAKKGVYSMDLPQCSRLVSDCGKM